MRRAAVLALATTLAPACTSFEDPTTVIDLRALTVRIEPSEIILNVDLTDPRNPTVDPTANPPLQTTSTAIFVFLNPDRQLWVDYHTGAANNNSRYASPAFDKLLDDARKEFDQAKQQTIYKDAAKMLIDDTPAVFISESLTRYYYHSHLKNWLPDDGSTNFLHYKKYDYVWLDGAPNR